MCLVVIALDQLTKHTLGTWIRPGQVRHVIPGLTLVYERNTGVAFSFLAGTGALVYVVTGVALVAPDRLLLMRPAAQAAVAADRACWSAARSAT